MDARISWCGRLLSLATCTTLAHAGALPAQGAPSVAPAQLPVGGPWSPVDPLALARRPTCSPSWLPTFGSQPGAGGGIDALAEHDDGSGPALYVAGSFTTATGGRGNRIARWDGSRWSALGSGLDGDVYALAVFDDGRGPALYAGGAFTAAGGVAASRIARWDGSSWAPLGSGLDGAVRALAVYDDGGGLALHAGGDFSAAGGVAASRIARWDGLSWTGLGAGIAGGEVHALAVYDDGGGPALHAGGTFTAAGSAPASHAARWDGSSWAPLGSGLDGAVHDQAVYDDGGGPDLCAVGHFRLAGGVATRDAARWNGSSWAALGSGFFDSEDDVVALAVYDDGSGPALYAGGSFFNVGGVYADDIAHWNGTDWEPLGRGMEDDHGAVAALAVYDDGGGPALFAGGSFTLAGGVGANGLARWDGSSWAPVGSGVSGDVRAMTVYDDGGGPALYAGGQYFTTMTAGGTPASWIAKWDGSSWSALGSGLGGAGDQAIVHALAVYDDGGGAALFAGGSFRTAGGVSANNIARWDGSSWAPLGSGVRGNYGIVQALAVFDDGSGPALYAGGTFRLAGSVLAKGIAKWNGSSWSSLGSGVGGASFSSVAALAVHDDGRGPALFAGGTFTSAGGVAANGIARWDGSRWSPLGSGADYPSVTALAVHDDGSGPALYAGGSFTTPSGAANGIARWDGASWAALGSGLNGSVAALAAHDDGDGAALYAGGSFTTAGGVAAKRVARWDGASWAALGNGVEGYAFDFVPSVLALAAFDDGGGPALFAGGAFASVIDSGDGFLGKWGRFDRTPPVLACPASLSVLDRLSDGPGEVVTFTVTATDDCDAEAVVVCVPPSGSTFARGTTLVACTATDAAGNESTCQFPVTVAARARRR